MTRTTPINDFAGLNITYVIHGNYGPSTGVGKKIRAQLQTWTELGASPEAVVVCDSTVARFWEDIDIPTTVMLRGGGRAAVSRPVQLHGRITEAGADVIYTRRRPWTPTVEAVFRSGVPIVLELNGPPPYLKHRRWLVRFQDRWTFGLAHRRAAGVVAVDEQLLGEWFDFGEDIPSVVVPNGVRLDDYPVLPAAPPGPPRIVFIATKASPHHGLEQLHAIAREAADLTFHVVGLAHGDVPGSSGWPANVEFHGRLRREQYEPIFARCTAGAASLNWGESGRTVNSSLKVREYLAFGLPVILAEQDADFPDGADFLLRVDSRTESIRHLVRRMRSFVERWQGQRVPRTDVASIDMKLKERQRLGFVAQIAGDTRP